MKPDLFEKKFQALEPGQTLVYHEGHLARGASAEELETARLARLYGFPTDEMMKVVGAERGTPPYGLGLGQLSQRRIGEDRYKYFITKAR